MSYNKNHSILNDYIYNLIDILDWIGINNIYKYDEFLIIINEFLYMIDESDYNHERIDNNINNIKQLLNEMGHQINDATKPIDAYDSSIEESLITNVNLTSNNLINYFKYYYKNTPELYMCETDEEEDEDEFKEFFDNLNEEDMINFYSLLDDSSPLTDILNS